jgi:hypothetical protein
VNESDVRLACYWSPRTSSPRSRCRSFAKTAPGGNVDSCVCESFQKACAYFARGESLALIHTSPPQRRFFFQLAKILRFAAFSSVAFQCGLVTYHNVRAYRGKGPCKGMVIAPPTSIQSRYDLPRANGYGRQACKCFEARLRLRAQSVSECVDFV